MKLARIELLVGLLGLLSALGWSLRSSASALSAAAGAAAGLLVFISVKAMALTLVGRRVTAFRALFFTAAKWALLAAGFAVALRWGVRPQGPALATGVTCLPAAVLAEALVWSRLRRINGARIQLGG